MQVTNEGQHIVWEGYGLRLHIPPNSLPEDCSVFQLKIAVMHPRCFMLPENGLLVSGVYSFSHDLGDRVLRLPVTVEMQHCATTSALNILHIVRADENSDKPNELKVIPGGIFDRSDGYGAIKLHHFCSLSTFLLWRLLSIVYAMNHCAKLYYTNIESRRFDFRVYVIPKLNCVFKVSLSF